MKNTKLINGGILISLILAGVFVGFVANDVIFDETKDLGSIIDKLTGKPSLPEQTQELQELTEQATLIIPENPNQWLEGESVKTNINYKKSFVKPNDARLETWPSDWTKIEEGIHQSFSNDNLKWGFEALVVTASTASVMHVTFELYAGQAGIFNYEWLLYTFENANVETYNKRSTYTTTSDHIDRDGHIQIHMWTQADSTFDIWDCEMEILDVENSEWDTIDINNEAWNHGNPDRYRILIDEIYYQADSTENNIRSEYRQTSPSTNEHRLFIENCDWNTEITIEKPLNWNISSVNPTASYSLIDNTIVIDNTVEATYEVLFTSVSEQYLAISQTYDFGFEGVIPSNFENHATNPYESMNINSTIVKEGAYSLELVNTVGNGYFRINHPSRDDWNSNDWYIRVSVYTLDNHDVYLNYYDGVDYINIDVSSANDRWEDTFYFYKSGQNVIDYFYIYTTEVMTIFLELEFCQVNHQIETIDYFNTRFSGVLNCWTSNGLNPVPYSYITAQIRDRTANTLIKEKELITDNSGFWFWDFQGKLDLKEYELRSYSLNNWFGCSETKSDITEDQDLDVWSNHSFTDYTESFSTDSKFESYSLQVEGYEGSGVDNGFFYDPSTFSVESSDLVIFWLKANESQAFPDFFFWESSGNYWYGTGLSGTTSTSWQQIAFFFKEYTTIGTPDPTNMDWFRVDLDYDEGERCLVNFDGFRFAQSQKSYFTPILVSDSDYFMNDDSLTWGKDGLDFQEESFSDFTSITAGGSTSVSDGYIQIITNATSGTNYASFGGSIDISPDEPISYWNTIKARVWTNESNIKGYFKFYLDGVKTTYSQQAFNPNVWTVLQWNTSEQSGDMIESFFGFYFVNGTGGATSIKATCKVDLFRLLHSDSGLTSGYSVEFNEDADTETETYAIYDLTEAGGPVSSVDNGKLITSFPDSIGHGHYFIKNTSISSDFVSLWVKGNSISGRYPGVRFGAISNGYISFIDLTSSNGEFETIIAIPDSCYSLGIWIGNSGSGAGVYTLDSVRFISENSPPNLYESETSFLLANEGLIEYITFTDSVYSGDYSNGEFIPKNLSIDSHTIAYTAYYNYFENMVTIPSVWYSYDYIIDEPGIMKIILHDQSSNVIAFDSFKVYIDSVRLYDNYLYFTDVSQTFNLTITDLFDNMLYQDTTETFEQFKEIQLTLHSVKVQNLQENPIWLQITRDAKTFSEWVFPYEIVKYRMEAATYEFKVYYCDSVSGDIENFETNGSWVNFEYAVSADSALMVTGQTIQDVFNNVISLTQDLDSVNASMHIAFEDQSQNFTLQFTATNQNITFVLGNSSIVIDTLNSNFTSILSDTAIIISNINSLDTNIASNFTYIFSNLTQIITDVANINVTTQVLGILANTSYIIAQLSDIDITLASNFTFMFSNFTQIFTNIANINVTTEVLDILADTANILGDLIILDSNIEANFSATFLAIAGNTTLLVNQLNSNFTDMQGLIISNNTVLYTQLVHTLADLAELKGLFTVHFDFVDGIGIGLSWETFKLYLNDSRQYGQDYYTPNQTQIRLKTYDYFNVSLDSANYTINNSCDISVIVDVYDVIFRNNNTQFKSIVDITRGGQSLILFVEPEGSVSHRFTEGIYTLNVSYIVESEIGYDIINPDNYTVGVHDLFQETFSIGSRLELMDQTLNSNIVDVGASDPTLTLIGIVQIQIATAFFFGVVIASCVSVLISYVFKTRIIEPVDEKIDFDKLRKGVQTPIVNASSDALGILPLTEKKHVKRTTEKDKRRRD